MQNDFVFFSSLFKHEVDMSQDTMRAINVEKKRDVHIFLRILFFFLYLCTFISFRIFTELQCDRMVSSGRSFTNARQFERPSTVHYTH